MFVLSDLFFEIDWNSIVPSTFDVEYHRIWSEKMEKGLLRFNLDIIKSKMVIGQKNSYLAQLDSDRALKKMDPQMIADVRQPFESNSFNFTRLEDNYIMFKFEGGAGEGEHIVAINDCPLENGHSLLIPQLSSKLPQILTGSALKFAINFLLSSGKPSFRAGFNGLLGSATLNHLHLHAYHLHVKMTLETIEVAHLIGRGYFVDKYPSKGFVFQIKSFDDIDPVVGDIIKITEMFLDKQLPHNLYVTRGLCFDDCDESSDVRSCLRIYLWARTPSSNMKEMTAVNPAFRELSGHCLIKDAKSFERVDETFIETTLESVTVPMFEKAIPLVKYLLPSV